MAPNSVLLKSLDSPDPDPRDSVPPISLHTEKKVGTSERQFPKSGRNIVICQLKE